MKRFLFSTVAILSCALGLGLLASAYGQVNVVPQVGVTTAYLPKQTYSAAFIGLVPAASATDVVCISGSASRRVQVHRITLSGSTSTLVTLPITLLRRATLDSGGTPASTTANPANTVSRRDTTFGAPTAVLVSYTANPTVNDAAPTYIDSANTTFVVTTAGTVTIPLVFDFAKDVENLLSPPVLRGVAQQLCLNFNSISVAAGVLTGSIVWTEE